MSQLNETQGFFFVVLPLLGGIIVAGLLVALRLFRNTGSKENLEDQGNGGNE